MRERERESADGKEGADRVPLAPHSIVGRQMPFTMRRGKEHSHKPMERCCWVGPALCEVPSTCPLPLLLRFEMCFPFLSFSRSFLLCLYKCLSIDVGETLPMLHASRGALLLRLQSATFVENPVNRVATVSLQLARSTPSEPYGFLFRKGNAKQRGANLALKQVPHFIVAASPVVEALFPDKGRIYAGSSVSLTSVNGISASHRTLVCKELEAGTHHSVSLAVQLGCRRTTKKKRKNAEAPEEGGAELEDSLEEGKKAERESEEDKKRTVEDEEDDAWFRPLGGHRPAAAHGRRRNAASKKRAAIPSVDSAGADAVAELTPAAELSPPRGTGARGRKKLPQPREETRETQRIESERETVSKAAVEETASTEVASLKKALTESFAAPEELRGAKRRASTKAVATSKGRRKKAAKAKPPKRKAPPTAGSAGEPPRKGPGRPRTLTDVIEF